MFGMGFFFWGGIIVYCYRDHKRILFVDFSNPSSTMNIRGLKDGIKWESEAFKAVWTDHLQGHVRDASHACLCPSPLLHAKTVAQKVRLRAMSCPSPSLMDDSRLELDTCGFFTGPPQHLDCFRVVLIGFGRVWHSGA